MKDLPPSIAVFRTLTKILFRKEGRSLPHPSPANENVQPKSNVSCVQKFSLILCDPPWNYRGQQQHNGKSGCSTGGAVSHYPTMKLKQLKAIPVAERLAAADSLLFLWTTGPHFDQAIDLGKHWGFAWATVAFVWHKGKANPGNYTMSECEFCLVFKRGRIPQPSGLRNVRQLISIPRGKHSAKLVEVRTSIDAMFPYHSKVELFARERAKGWTSLGLDLGVDLSQGLDLPPS